MWLCVFFAIWFVPMCVFVPFYHLNECKVFSKTSTNIIKSRKNVLFRRQTFLLPTYQTRDHFESVPHLTPFSHKGILYIIRFNTVKNLYVYTINLNKTTCEKQPFNVQNTQIIKNIQISCTQNIFFLIKLTNFNKIWVTKKKFVDHNLEI